MIYINATVKIEDAQSARVLEELQALRRAVMTQSEKIAALTTRLDAATTEIANDLKDLRDKIAAGTVTDEDLTGLDGIAARLEAMGKDPENPVPEPAPPVEG